MDFGQYTGPKQAESRPVRPRFGHLWDFSDSFLKLSDNSEMGSLWPLEGDQNGAGNTVSVPFVPPESDAQGCQSDLSDGFQTAFCEVGNQNCNK